MKNPDVNVTNIKYPQGRFANTRRDALQINTRRDGLQINTRRGALQINTRRDALQINTRRDALQINTRRDALQCLPAGIIGIFSCILTDFHFFTYFSPVQPKSFNILLIMKNLFTILFITVCLTVQAQRSIEFMYGYGNNGQVQSAINEYYYPSDALYLLDESSIAKIGERKKNYSARIYFNSRWSIRFRHGRMNIDNEYHVGTNQLNGVFQISQKINNFNTAICISEHIGRLSISTGLEYAHYKVSEHLLQFDGVEAYIYNSFPYYPNVDADITMDGGKIKGINSFAEVAIYPSSYFGLGVNFSFGMMSAKFGDKVHDNVKFTNPPNLPSGPQNYSIFSDKKYEKKYFSDPEISMFLILRLGNKHSNVKAGASSK
jgi:hypothetical protein